jgi:GTPase SAR1 family protein
LVVTIVGPCGSGKSSLLNALAGVDDLSRIGHERPTTDHIIVFSRHRGDAGQLVEKLGSHAQRVVVVESSPAAELLEHVLLIDTPDTDSRAYEKHIPMVREAIGQSDMLICVFDAENPKRRDHVDFLAPFIRKFHGESLVGVINKCDRLDEQDLKNRILPDFFDYIQSAWPVTVDRMLCVSARRHLRDPQWDPSAEPKHDFDQFDELRKMVFDRSNRAGYVVDRRLENVRSLRNFVFGEVRQEINRNKSSLVTAERQIKEAEKQALLDTVVAMKSDDSRQFFGIGLMVYQKLIQRWVGPMGWMIALWARLLIFGTGLAGLFRVGHPVRQIMGMISAWRHLKEAKSAASDIQDDERVGTGFRVYRLSTLRNWPDIAESLVNGGFVSAVRRAEDMLPAGDIFSDRITGVWSASLESEIERVSRRLSGWPLQTVFNLPAFGMMGYTGWLTLLNFFEGTYLTGNFFLHALWSIVIILLLSFFILQACIRLAAGAERITGRAFDAMKRRVDQLDEITHNPVRVQLETLIGLDAVLASRDS